MWSERSPLENVKRQTAQKRMGPSQRRKRFSTFTFSLFSLLSSLLFCLFPFLKVSFCCHSWAPEFHDLEDHWISSGAVQAVLSIIIFLLSKFTSDWWSLLRLISKKKLLYKVEEIVLFQLCRGESGEMVGQWVNWTAWKTAWKYDPIIHAISRWITT